MTTSDMKTGLDSNYTWIERCSWFLLERQKTNQELYGERLCY